jgi:hypothetical protein
MPLFRRYIITVYVLGSNMTPGTAANEILEAINLTICDLPGREILDTGEAFEIAQRIAEQTVSILSPNLDDAGKRRAVTTILNEAYYTARENVAAQFIGTTLEEIIETTKAGRHRFQGLSELAITAKPTLSYTGKCEPLEPWNLYSNAIHAHTAAMETKAKGIWSPSDEVLLTEIKRARQMLHFLCQREIDVSDIDGKAFNGKIKHQIRPVRLS